MSRFIRLTPLAREDLLNGAKWYESQQSGLGRQFLREFRASCSTISERPQSFPLVHRDMRRALMHRFPYGVFFFDDRDKLVVCGILDMRRNPTTFKRLRNRGD